MHGLDPIALSFSNILLLHFKIFPEKITGADYLLGNL